jgi:hypothetical protein
MNPHKMGRKPAASSAGWQFPQAIGVEVVAASARLRQGFGAASVACIHERRGLPSRSSFSWTIGPASALVRKSAQRYGAASFACIHERRMVAQICPRWNPLTSWMRQIEDFQRAA